MLNEELERKKLKAKVYAEQPDRFELIEMKLKMNSNNGVRDIFYNNGKWHCSCDFFQKADTCSHTMALEEIIKFKMEDK